MNTFWLKVAGIIVAIILVFALITMFTSDDTQEPEQTEQPERTFAQQVEADKEEFSNLPQPVDSQDENRDQAAANETTTENTQAVPAHPKPVEPVTLYFKPMSEIEEMEAERLLNTAVPGRSIGRLPMTGFKLMVDTCRQIIKRWPDSRYAYNAKKLMADMPERFRPRYNVTQEEMDVSMYAESRPGTQPYTIKEER